MTTLKGRLYFHPPDVPMQVWAVRLNQSGVHWFDAEITKVTKRNVMVRYRGEIARLNRETLWYGWAFWRGVRFVSSRTGRIAAILDGEWHRRYGTAGAVPPSMQMPLDQARAFCFLDGTSKARDDVFAGVTPTSAELPKCSGCWSRRVTACLRPWAQVRRRPSHRHTRPREYR